MNRKTSLGLLAVAVTAMTGLAGIPAARAGSLPKLVEPVPIDRVYTNGDIVQFSIKYTDADNDPPLEAGVILFPPDGQKLKRSMSASDLQSVHSGSLITIVYPIDEPGHYQYHFFARDPDGLATYPDRAELTFRAQPNWWPWAVIGCGLVVAFLIVSTLVYQVMHRGFGATQTMSARLAVMIGCICWMICIFYAENWLTNTVAWIAGGIVLLLMIVWALIAK